MWGLGTVFFIFAISAVGITIASSPKMVVNGYVQAIHSRPAMLVVLGLGKNECGEMDGRRDKYSFFLNKALTIFFPKQDGK